MGRQFLSGCCCRHGRQSVRDIYAEKKTVGRQSNWIRWKLVDIRGIGWVLRSEKATQRRMTTTTSCPSQLPGFNVLFSFLFCLFVCLFFFCFVLFLFIFECASSLTSNRSESSECKKPMKKNSEPEERSSGRERASPGGSRHRLSLLQLVVQQL